MKDKNILPDLKNIAASFIQILYKKHLKKIHSELRIEMLKRLFNNLNDDNIIFLYFPLSLNEFFIKSLNEFFILFNLIKFTALGIILYNFKREVILGI